MADHTNRARDSAVAARSDISRFVVHITRDDTKNYSNGQSARKNLKAILRECRVGAFSPHCLHVKQIPEENHDDFAVCCFTETPLSELHLLTRHIPGRSIELSDYGIVFSRQFLISKGAQPALYLNLYDNNQHLREAARNICDIVSENGFRRTGLAHLLPFLNTMNERHDFAWEREWRIAGDLHFDARDIVAVIVPETGERMLTRKYLERGIPVISPGWSTERIVAEFSEQARTVRRIWRTRVPKTERKRPR